ncbi:MAG TPA: PilZ domain-containing protein [Baekduia sp.]|jgi:hypothetical protein
MSRLMPAVGDELLLAVPHTEQVLVRVEADGEGYLDLALLEKPLTPRPQLERSALMIEFINDDGVARMHGRIDVPKFARGRGTAYGREDILRFAHRGSPQLMQRRDYVRAEVALPLTLLVGGADDAPVTARAQTLDVSGGGMLVRGLPGPKLGDEHGFELALDDGAPIRARGRVVRLVGIDSAGVQFTDVQHADRERLVHAAFDMSRDQHRRFG